MDFQLIQAMLADCRTRDPGRRARWCCKQPANATLARDVTLNALDLQSTSRRRCAAGWRTAACEMHGGYGYIADHGIERFYRDVRLFRLYEGNPARSIS